MLGGPVDIIFDITRAYKKANPRDFSGLSELVFSQSTADQDTTKEKKDNRY
jgi:hypothetical protein